jgi:Flagellar hook-length control protein FliK
MFVASSHQSGSLPALSAIEDTVFPADPADDIKARGNVGAYFMDLLARITTSPPAPSAEPIVPLVSLPLSLSPYPLLSSGYVEVHMDLQSGELGTLHVRVAMHKCQVNVHIMVQDDEAKRSLDEKLELLRAGLTSIGVALAKFEVETDKSSHSEHREPEFSADLSQPEREGSPNLGKARAQVSNPQTLVDIIA